MVGRKRFASLYHAERLISLIILFVIVNTISAQGSNRNLQIELITETNDGDVLVHVRLSRGQRIEEASLSQADNTITLEADVLALDVTQFIILDASNEMVNLQSVVQSNVPRFWRASEHLTSLIFFDNTTEILQATNRTEDIDNFLTNYSITPGSPACLGEALTAINNLERDYERTWRILLVTVGDFSRQASCRLQDLPTLPAPIDVIAITDTIDSDIQDLVDRSGGQIFNANLRSVETRINEILSQWGQSTYALRGTLTEAWNPDEEFELDVRISNGTQETITLKFRDYNVPLPTIATLTSASVVITPTATISVESTTSNLAIIENTAIPTLTPEINPPTDNQDDSSNGVAILLIVGAVLFVIGAVVLALALSRVRRAPVDDQPVSPPNFYQTLDSLPTDDNDRRIRERNIIMQNDDEPVTQIADSDTIIEDLDELLVTQVLSDDRFRTMMEQSQNNDEVVGWMRLLGQTIDRDFELTTRGAIIGRSQECDIQITGDGAISRKHVRLDVRGINQVTVSRLSAVNPVLIAGIQINNRHPLVPNDVIHLSDETRLIFISKDAQAEDDDDNDDTNPF